METHGTIAPASLDEAEATFNRIGPAAQVVVREMTEAMELGHEKYSERVTGDVIETIRNALFAGSLSVTVGTRIEFGDWRPTHEGCMVVELGSPDVERVAWHVVPFAGTVLATTFRNEEDAVVSTLRHNAFGRIYRGTLLEEETGGDDDALAGADDNIAAGAVGTDNDTTGADR